jgi:hypothetical protein
VLEIADGIVVRFADSGWFGAIRDVEQVASGAMLETLRTPEAIGTLAR